MEPNHPARNDGMGEYETEHYRNACYMVDLEDRTESRGRAFKWIRIRDAAELKEGACDLKDWLQHNLEC